MEAGWELDEEDGAEVGWELDEVLGTALEAALGTDDGTDDGWELDEEDGTEVGWELDEVLRIVLGAPLGTDDGTDDGWEVDEEDGTEAIAVIWQNTGVNTKANLSHIHSTVQFVAKVSADIEDDENF